MYPPPADQPILTIEKELIPTLRFGPEDVLTTDPAAEQRRRDAERAARLGNAHHGKLDIFFQTADRQTLRGHPAVWGAHPEYLTLKAGILLPLRAVLGFQ